MLAILHSKTANANGKVIRISKDFCWGLRCMELGNYLSFYGYIWMCVNWSVWYLKSGVTKLRIAEWKSELAFIRASNDPVKTFELWLITSDVGANHGGQEAFASEITSNVHTPVTSSIFCWKIVLHPLRTLSNMKKKTYIPIIRSKAKISKDKRRC